MEKFVVIFYRHNYHWIFCNTSSFTYSCKWFSQESGKLVRNSISWSCLHHDYPIFLVLSSKLINEPPLSSFQEVCINDMSIWSYCYGFTYYILLSYLDSFSELSLSDTISWIDINLSFEIACLCWNVVYYSFRLAPEQKSQEKAPISFSLHLFYYRDHHNFGLHHHHCQEIFTSLPTIYCPFVPHFKRNDGNNVGKIN